MNLIALAAFAAMASATEPLYYNRTVEDQRDVGSINENFRTGADAARRADLTSGGTIDGQLIVDSLCFNSTSDCQTTAAVSTGNPTYIVGSTLTFNTSTSVAGTTTTVINYPRVTGFPIVIASSDTNTNHKEQAYDLTAVTFTTATIITLDFNLGVRGAAALVGVVFNGDYGANYLHGGDWSTSATGSSVMTSDTARCGIVENTATVAVNSTLSGRLTIRMDANSVNRTTADGFFKYRRGSDSLFIRGVTGCLYTGTTRLNQITIYVTSGTGFLFGETKLSVQN